MGLPINKVAAGGLPVTIATSGYGLPCSEAPAGYGIAVTEAPAGGGGLAVTGFAFGPTVAITATSVLETAAINTTVGTLSVSGSYTGTPVFTLSDSAGGKFNISGALLRTNALLDYETATFHNVTVAVSGTTPATTSRVITILVTDVAEPVILLTGTTVNEDAAVNTTVGTLSIGNTYTGSPVYALVDSAGGKFNISGALLRVNAALDYETAATHSVTISVSGITPAAANKAFTVVVLDITEAATAAWDPSNKSSLVTLSGSNLTVVTGEAPFSYCGVKATASASTGKFYSEHAFVEDNGYPTFMGIGISNAARSLNYEFAGSGSGGTCVGMNGGGEVHDSTMAGTIVTVSAFAEGAIVCMAVDLDNNKIWFKVGAGTWNNTGADPTNPATGITINAPVVAGKPLFPFIHHVVSPGLTTNQTTTSNFGATTYSQTRPAGYSNWGGGGAVGTTKNIVTDYGAVGDAQWAQATLSITTNTLTSATAIWPGVAGDYVGKAVVVGKCGGSAIEAGGGSVLRTTITGRPDASTLTLANNCVSTLSSEPNVIVAWGTDNGKKVGEEGAVADGPFAAFRTAYQGQSVTLTIPAGNYLISSGNFGPLGAGIRNLTINATGATLCGGAFQLGSYAQYTGNGHSGSTASVTAGATFVTLLTPSEVSKFVIGNYAMMTGFGLQYGGYPSNHQRFEYFKITAIDSDSGSPTYGKITFLTPLVNSYLSTWPLYVGESGGSLSSGGPATLYAMDPKFDHTTVINNLALAHHPQMPVSGLDVTLNNCVFESIWGPHATMGKTIVFNNCFGTKCTMEVDKIVTSLTLTGCDWSGLSFQSTCITDCILDNTDIRYSIVGSPWKLTIRNGSAVGTISGIGVLAPGAGYGYSNELIVSDSTVKGFGAGSTHESGYVIPGKSDANNGVNNDWAMSGGVITIPSSTYADIYTPLWPVTNGRAFMSTPTRQSIGLFRITDVTQSGSAVSVTTTLSGGWPTRESKIFLKLHPAPICTFTNVTGCPEVVDLSQAAAAGLPLYSYSKRSYTGSVAVMDYWQVWGRVKKIVVTVTQAYTGVFGGAVTLTLGIFVENTLIKMSDYSDVAWNPTIDLKRTGTRTFDATAGTYPVASWSNTATAHADVLPGMTEALWAPGNFRPSMTDISAEAAGLRPIFSIEVITDQGF